MNKKYIATIFAILAAALYAINIPLSKILLQQVSPTMMAAFLYLGAGLGLFIYHCFTRKNEKSEPHTKEDIPYTLGDDCTRYCCSYFTDVKATTDKFCKRISS